MRGRIVKINGIPVSKVKVADDSKWAIRGDRVLTYSKEKKVASKIVAGKWWPKNYEGAPLISLDASLAKGFNVEVGDTLTINILGRNVLAKIASLRQINWRNLQFDFAIIFSPGVLENAPLTHIAAIEIEPIKELALERIINEKFPNITIIGIRQALKAAQNILIGIGSAIKSAASVTILSGAIVLSGIMASEQQRRIYESIIFKVLGATPSQVLGAYLIEYGIVALLTSLISSIIGSIISWIVA